MPFARKSDRKQEQFLHRFLVLSCSGRWQLALSLVIA
jgi:hypothetical protein